MGKYIELKGTSVPRGRGRVPNVPAFRLMASFADIWVPVSAQETDAYLQLRFGV